MALVRGRLVPDYKSRTTSQSGDEHRREQAAIRAGDKIPRSKLRKGMRVKSPEFVLEDGAHRKFASYWGVNPPRELTVTSVDHDYGSITLTADNGELMEPNAEDLPTMFEIAKKR